MKKIAINGFGRIGRNILRSYLSNNNQNIKIVAINDLQPIETAVHLLKYDSVHQKLNNNIRVEGNSIVIDDQVIEYYSERNPSDLPWNKLNIDIAMECTGLFTNRDDAEKHIKAGAKKVIISAPAKGADKTIVFGVNHETINENDIIISNASCTTNCLAPIINALNKEFDVVSGIMTTIHSYTGDQSLIDAPHSDLFRARAGALSMIPTKTGAAEAIGLVIPELNGKLKGMAIRVPTPNVSLVDLSIVLNSNNKLDKDVINKLMKNNSNNVFGYNEEKLVSIDYNGEKYSSIFDSTQTIVSELGDCNYLVKLFSWYDNETGFSNRMLDLANYLK